MTSARQIVVIPSRQRGARSGQGSPVRFDGDRVACGRPDEIAERLASEAADRGTPPKR